MKTFLTFALLTASLSASAVESCMVRSFGDGSFAPKCYPVSIETEVKLALGEKATPVQETTVLMERIGFELRAMTLMGSSRYLVFVKE